MRAEIIVALVTVATVAEAKPCVEEATVSDLWICGKPKEAPSHGGEELVRNAHYALENRGDKPITVELVTLDVVDPRDKPTRLAIDYANFLPAPTGVTRALIAPGKKIDLVIFGKGSTRGLQYHVVYRHRVLFRVGGVERHVLASEMYFRHPLKRR